MPFALDEEKLKDPKTVTMDLGNPPVKSIPVHPFPKCVYLHPKDKSKEHLTKIVHNQAELELAMNQGYRKEPHVPIIESELPDGFEPDVAEAKRGPGRPKNTPDAV